MGSPLPTVPVCGLQDHRHKCLSRLETDTIPASSLEVGKASAQGSRYGGSCHYDRNSSGDNEGAQAHVGHVFLLPDPSRIERREGLVRTRVQPLQTPLTAEPDQTARYSRFVRLAHGAKLLSGDDTVVEWIVLPLLRDRRPVELTQQAVGTRLEGSLAGSTAQADESIAVDETVGLAHRLQGLPVHHTGLERVDGELRGDDCRIDLG